MNKKFFLKLLAVIIIALAAVLLIDKSCLPAEKDGHDYLMQMFGQSYLEKMKQDDSIAFFYAYGYFNRVRNNYNSSVIQIEVDRSCSVGISAEDLKKVFDRVESSYRLAGINLKIYLDDTLLSVGKIRTLSDLRETLRKTRDHRDMIHIILADEINAPIYGWTQYNSGHKEPSQKDLDRTGTYIFYENIRLRADVDSIIFDYTDSILTTGELLAKVMTHEIGHSLCLDDNPGYYYVGSLYSVMNQGSRITLINGPNNRGPEFTKGDLSRMDRLMILGIDRSDRYYKEGFDLRIERNICKTSLHSESHQRTLRERRKNELCSFDIWNFTCGGNYCNGNFLAL